MSEMRKAEDPVKRVVIAGGGNIGLRLAQTLEDDRYQVKIIERDTAARPRISEQLRNTIVLTGDAADEELLVEENIDSADVFCALTNSEEANILSAMLAKRLGAHRVMALISRPAYAELMETGPIDVAISPQTVTIGSLLAYVRRGDVVQVHSLRARRGRGDGDDRARHPRRQGGRATRSRTSTCPTARTIVTHRARRRSDHGAPRHGDRERRPRDPVPRRPAPRRAGRAPVPDLNRPYGTTAAMLAVVTRPRARC